MLYNIGVGNLYLHSADVSEMHLEESRTIMGFKTKPKESPALQIEGVSLGHHPVDLELEEDQLDQVLNGLASMFGPEALHVYSLEQKPLHLGLEGLIGHRVYQATMDTIQELFVDDSPHETAVEVAEKLSQEFSEKIFVELEKIYK